MCKEDPWRWITHWLHTIDAADGSTPEKLFPNKEHLFTFTRIWERYTTLLVPKSRQMTISWMCCALYLWEGFFFSHRLTFFQSKKQEDAGELILRAYQMWASLPKWMREWNHMERIQAYAEFSRSRSRIFAIAQGADQVRSYTPSGVLVDEAAYVLEADKLIAAIRPAIRSGGRLTMVSSAAPSYFSLMVTDNL